MTVDVRIRRLPHAEGLPLPAYETMPPAWTCGPRSTKPHR
jgi:hypothetical protein